MSPSIYRKLKSCFIIMTLIIGMSFIIGCGTEVGNNDDIPASPITDNSWDELETYIKDEFSESVLPSDVHLAGGWFAAAAELDDVAATNDSGNYSQTNIQEQDVDEADKVKTDGTYLYIADEDAVHIVDALPADSMEISGTINVNGYIDSLYLNSNTLIVLYRFDEGSDLPWTITRPCLDVGINYCMPVKASVGILMLDVSDPSSPEWMGEWTIDGWMVSSRLTNGKLYIVQQFLPDLPPLQVTYDGTEEGRDEAIAANMSALDSVSIDELIPYYTAIDEQGDTVENAPLIIPEDFIRPDEPNGGSIVSIVTFDLDDISGGFESTGLIADAHTVYASTRALYVASTQWNYEVEPFTPSSDYYNTFLYRFSLTGENVILEGAGEVSGKVLNQFSMGEYNDVLRIATSTGNLWGATLQSNVYCLEVINNSLEVIGSLEGLAPGEDIYSARFIGNRGFLVTFVKVDPLFTLDLSDPSNPLVAGELKVPGYSDYIHLLGDNHLLTIGKDTVLDNGWVWYQGLQLSIFDISDFSNPQLIHTELIGDRGTESEALHNHKAFTFWAESGLLAIPVDLYEHQAEPDYPYTFGEYAFSGLYVYRVTVEEGFAYLGSISTDSAIWNTYSGDNWLRGLFIEEDVYAVNDEAVRSANIDDIEGSLNTLFLQNAD